MTKEKQAKFLDALFEQKKVDIRAAMRDAGYSDATQPNEVLGGLEESIKKRINVTLRTKGALMAMQGLMSALDDPKQLGVQNLISASEKVLDRSGHGKQQEVEVKTQDPIFYLPTKDETE